jgi:hypothetical protein
MDTMTALALVQGQSVRVAQETNGMIAVEMQDMMMGKTDHSANQHMIIVEMRKAAILHITMVSLKDVWMLITQEMSVSLQRMLENRINVFNRSG